MTSDNDVRVVDTGSLGRLIFDAAKRKYNRQIDPKMFEEHADPDGVHVLCSLMLHTHAAGQLTDPHARCRVLIKVKNQELPAEAWLDVYVKHFEALPTLESTTGAQDDG